MAPQMPPAQSQNAMGGMAGLGGVGGFGAMGGSLPQANQQVIHLFFAVRRLFETSLKRHSKLKDTFMISEKSLHR